MLLFNSGGIQLLAVGFAVGAFSLVLVSAAAVDTVAFLCYILTTSVLLLLKLP